MNLISCETCGVVLDKDQLVFPQFITGDDSEFFEENAIWNGHDYVAIVPCPVCKTPIREE